MNKLTREEVYDIIDSERDYQDSLGDNRTDHSQKTVGDYTVMMTYYNTKLLEAWTNNAGTVEALNVMRKLAGIAVKCMEEHGSQPRSFNVFPIGGL